MILSRKQNSEMDIKKDDDIDNVSDSGRDLSSIQTLATDLANNPSKFSEFIKETSQSLEKARKTAKEIKDRNFFQRIITFSSKDTAEISLTHQDVMERFFVLLLTISLVSGKNSAVLVGLMNSMKNGLDMNDAEQKNLYEFASAYFESAIKSAEDEQLRERALKKVMILSADLHHSSEDFSKRYEDFVAETQQSFNKTTQRIETLATDVEITLEEQKKDIFSRLKEFDSNTKQSFDETNKSIETLAEEHRNSIEQLNKLRKVLVASIIMSIVAVTIAIVAISL